MRHKKQQFANLEQWCEHHHHQLAEYSAPLAACLEFVRQYDLSRIIYYQTTLEQLSIQIAANLLELEVEPQTLSAGILYPVIHSYNITDPDELHSAPPIAVQISQNVSKLDAIDTHYQHDSDLTLTQADNLRRMILAMVDDPRAILIKLAEKIVWLTAMKNDDDTNKKQAGNIAIQLYAPLASRLGIGQLKWQLEDLAFRYTHPDIYFAISKGLNMRRTEREDFVKEMQNTITTLFKQASITQLNLTGRAKHIYSIHRKINRKKVNLDQIYDSTALRILVMTIAECYEALSIIHTHWTAIECEFDDYIANPKPNGYQSIHTAITVPGKGHVEIQIRTFQMHHAAELGVAAHWKYKEKEGGTKSSSYENKIELLRQLLDWQKNVNQALDKDRYQTIFGDRIYVFSPNGEVFNLAAGATALDFAYLIHTQVGHRCRGAKINGKLSTLTQALKTGDQVQIVTGKDDKPSRDWLNLNLGYLTTSHAIGKVRHYFRRETHTKNLTLGETLWEKSCRRTGIKRNVIEKLYDRFNFTCSKDLLAALGANDISTATINHAAKNLEPNTPPTKVEAIEHIKTVTPSSSSSGFIIAGVENLITQVGKCCRPIPGDNIIGYITQGRGITIHKSDCRNIDQARQHKADRLIEVEWGSQELFTIHLKITTIERQGLINEITAIIVKSTIQLLGLNSHTDHTKSITYIDLSLEIKSLDAMTALLNKLNDIQGIIEIHRQ